MDPIGCMILLSNLSGTRKWLLPGERVLFHEHWQHCLGQFAEEVGADLRAGEFMIWVDGLPVVDPASNVPVTCGSQFALSLGRDKISTLVPHGIWWN